MNMRDVFGMVNFHCSPELKPLTDCRPIGSTSFLGRYALCDFALSNFCNSGISRVGLLVKDHERSILKHIGGLDSWTQNTKTGQMRVLINEEHLKSPEYNTDVNNIVAELLQQKLGQHKTEEIQELILDKLFNLDKFTEDHKTTLEKYTSLVHLTLNNVGLTSLENFPQLKEVQIIELNNNQLNGDDISTLVEKCPELYKIKLEGNNIDNLDKLKSLAGHKLTKINLEGNPLVKSNPNYKKELFELIPSLHAIDGTDKEGEPVESTIYGEEEDGEEEDDEFDAAEGNEIDEDGESQDYDDEYGEDGEDDEEDEDDEDEKPNKKTKK